MKKLFHIILFIFLLGWSSDGIAQSVSLNAPLMEEYLRRQQLLGEIDSTFSFAIRPVYPEIAFDKYDGMDLDDTFVDYDISELNSKFAGDKGRFQMLPAILKTSFTSKYSFGINDGPMIPARGLQNMLSAGFFLKYGKLSLQFQPEIVLAQNKDYLGFPIDHQSTILFYYEWLNRIDAPERFGTAPYNGIFSGQSSIRFNTSDISVGISTENLWWGPGKRNSLLMSNNAPGFLHFTVNTQKPILTDIGSFEGQLIAGRLENSGYAPPHSDFIWQQTAVYYPKRDEDWRYLSGLIVSYQPKWVPGLFLGFSSVSQMYHNDMDRFKDFLPIFNGEKSSREIANPDRNLRDQMSAGFFRWLSPKGHFEFYGEYGSKGNDRRLHDFLINPDLNRAFTFGFVNYRPIRNDAYFQIAMEMTQTGQTVRETIRNVDSWYVHDHVRHGYTHRGQVLGAGNGPGSNVIFLELSWIREFNRLGFQFERIVYNNDFYYYRFEHIKDWRVKYVDLVPALVADWRFDQLLVSAKLQYVNTLNYKWYLENHPELYFVPGMDRKNFVGNFGIAYIFK